MISFLQVLFALGMSVSWVIPVVALLGLAWLGYVLEQREKRRDPGDDTPGRP